LALRVVALSFSISASSWCSIYFPHRHSITPYTSSRAAWLTASQALSSLVISFIPPKRLIELHPLSRRYCKERRYRDENDSRDFNCRAREQPCAHLG
jgi:hypothetical protein